MWNDIAAIRRSRLFDADWYKTKYATSPLRSVNPLWYEPLWHYLCCGRRLDPNPMFDGEWYIAQRPGVVSPLAHYLRWGTRQGVDPNPNFSDWWYLRRYPDARESPLSPLEHYLHVGVAEGRDPRPPPGSPRFRGAGLPQPWPAHARPAAKGPGADSTSGRRLCLFSHFDAGGRIFPCVQHYLRAIRECGFEVHVVSASPSIDRRDRAAVEAMGIAVHLRENSGFDFGAWQWGLHRLSPSDDVDWLLLANDSVFGPIFDLVPVVHEQIDAGADFWGLTDSYEFAWHLQSYFVCFRGDVARSAAFRAVFAQDFARGAKRGAIHDGEIFLSQALIDAGYRPAVVWPFDRLDAGWGVCNPMHFYWDRLIAQQRCPFVKRELVRDNPAQIPSARRWKHVLDRYTGYDSALIVEYLQARPRP